MADTEAADINTVNGLTAGDLDGSALRVISGSASAIKSALEALNTPPSEDMTGVNISGAANATDISSILDDNSFIKALDGSELTSITGTTTQVVAALTDLDGNDPASFDVVATGSYCN